MQEIYIYFGLVSWSTYNRSTLNSLFENFRNLKFRHVTKVYPKFLKLKIFIVNEGRQKNNKTDDRLPNFLGQVILLKLTKLQLLDKTRRFPCGDLSWRITMYLLVNTVLRFPVLNLLRRVHKSLSLWYLLNIY